MTEALKVNKSEAFSQAKDYADRVKDGVEDIKFDSNHSDNSAIPSGRYDEVDPEDRVTVGKDTVTALQFATEDRFASYGDEYQRLGLLRNASKYEVHRSQRGSYSKQAIADDLQAAVEKKAGPRPPLAEAEAIQNVAAVDAQGYIQGEASLFDGILSYFG